MNIKVDAHTVTHLPSYTLSIVVFGVHVSYAKIAYLQLEKYGRVVVAGNNLMGGFGGFVAGGGYATFTPGLGLSVDNILEIKVIYAPVLLKALQMQIIMQYTCTSQNMLTGNISILFVHRSVRHPT